MRSSFLWELCIQNSQKIFKNNIIQGIFFNSALLFLILNRSSPAGKDAVEDLSNSQHVFVSRTDKTDTPYSPV